MARDGERVTPLELFFDLVFVLALTQCTALMARTPTWEGLLKGVLVLGMWGLALVLERVRHGVAPGEATSR
jgi:low temperature requirement protein LtrA